MLRRPDEGPQSERPKDWFHLNPHWDSETKQDKLYGFIFRVFPAFVISFGLLALVLFFTTWSSHATLGHLLHSLCISYTVCFAILGIPVFVLAESSVIKMRWVILILLVGSVIIGMVFWYVLDPYNDDLNQFVSGFYWAVNRVGFEVSLYSTIGGVIVIALGSMFATYGVLAVVLTYFSKNFHRIMLSLERNDESKLCRSARNLFRVPTIIDVDEVTLDPETDDSVFRKDVFVRVAKYEVLAGLIIASYLFLNPVFMQTMDYSEMMTVIILLSLFVSTLTVPVSIVRSLGATAHSTGNRPFVLWKGMKERMFRPGFYIALFLTLLWISLFVNTSEDILTTYYLGYLMYMVLLACLVSFIYVNAFYVPLKNGIARNFYRYREEHKGKE